MYIYIHICMYHDRHSADGHRVVHVQGIACHRLLGGKEDHDQRHPVIRHAHADPKSTRARIRAFIECMCLQLEFA